MELLTAKGKSFITHICEVGMKPDGNGNTLLMGKNSYNLPFCELPAASQTWACHIKIPNKNTLVNKEITTATELSDALIYWFNYYAEMFGLDANVIAAQAYTESGYKMWNYAGGNSTASGINQFLTTTLYEVIVRNNGKPYTNTNTFTNEEVEKIITGLYNTSVTSIDERKVDVSYSVGRDPVPVTDINPSNLYKIGWNNRPILHQNVINNPDIMIKAQCIYMKYIASLCDSLTSSTLFGYSRGPGYSHKTYTAGIQKCKKIEGDVYLQEGLNYVLKIFGILGDMENVLVKQIGYVYKPKNFYFGYDEGMGDSPKNLRLTEAYDVSKANIAQSSVYDTTTTTVKTA